LGDAAFRATFYGGALTGLFDLAGVEDLSDTERFTSFSSRSW